MEIPHPARERRLGRLTECRASPVRAGRDRPLYRLDIPPPVLIRPVQDEITQMKRVAVLGGGPAGAFAAERLARAGLETVVLDEKLAWEKPCGGGLTYKAYSRYPFLLENNVPKKIIHETCLAAHPAGAVHMDLSNPLLIYSRMDLNRMLLDRAEHAGAQLEKTRVLGIER